DWRSARHQERRAAGHAVPRHHAGGGVRRLLRAGTARCRVRSRFSRVSVRLRLLHGVQGPGSGSCLTAKNRVARFTAGYQGNPDRADPPSQVILLDDIDSDAGNHNGGWLDFGPLDGKLYVSTGDGGSVHTKSQDLNSLNGKILRLNPDGTVPFDNPFLGL